MTEQQIKQFIQEFADMDKEAYANLVLFSEAENERELIAKETNSAIYRYVAEMPSRLWDYIQIKLPKD